MSKNIIQTYIQQDTKVKKNFNQKKYQKECRKI